MVASDHRNPSKIASSLSAAAAARPASNLDGNMTKNTATNTTTSTNNGNNNTTLMTSAMTTPIQQVHLPYIKASLATALNPRFRPSMEDTCRIINNFMDLPGSAYCAVFDGHAGDYAALYCSELFHKTIEQFLVLFGPGWDFAEIMAAAFEHVDKQLMASPGYDSKSGCTAAVALVSSIFPQQPHHKPSDGPATNWPCSPPPPFLSHLPPPPSPASSLSSASSSLSSPSIFSHPNVCSPPLGTGTFPPISPQPTAATVTTATAIPPTTVGINNHSVQRKTRRSYSSISPASPSILHHALASNTGATRTTYSHNFPPAPQSNVAIAPTMMATNFVGAPTSTGAAAPTVTSSSARSLYTCNVGDSRIVLCSRGTARALSYDHRATDKSEVQRIVAVPNSQGTGNFTVRNGRVNGNLTVTRALGDQPLKPAVCARPYVTQTVLDPEADEFAILASDGLWDVCSNQKAVDEVRYIEDPTEAAAELVRYALNNNSRDNITCLVVRFRPAPAKEEEEVRAGGEVETPKATDVGTASLDSRIVCKDTVEIKILPTSSVSKHANTAPKTVTGRTGIISPSVVGSVPQHQPQQHLQQQQPQPQQQDVVEGGAAATNMDETLILSPPDSLHTHGYFPDPATAGELPPHSRRCSNTGSIGGGEESGAITPTVGGAHNMSRTVSRKSLAAALGALAGGEPVAIGVSRAGSSSTLMRMGSSAVIDDDDDVVGEDEENDVVMEEEDDTDSLPFGALTEGEEETWNSGKIQSRRRRTRTLRSGREEKKKKKKDASNEEATLEHGDGDEEGIEDEDEDLRAFNVGAMRSIRSSRSSSQSTVTAVSIGSVAAAAAATARSASNSSGGSGGSRSGSGSSHSGGGGGSHRRTSFVSGDVPPVPTFGARAMHGGPGGVDGASSGAGSTGAPSPRLFYTRHVRAASIAALGGNGGVSEGSEGSGLQFGTSVGRHLGGSAQSGSMMRRRVAGGSPGTVSGGSAGLGGQGSLGHGPGFVEPVVGIPSAPLKSGFMKRYTNRTEFLKPGSVSGTSISGATTPSVMMMGGGPASSSLSSQSSLSSSASSTFSTTASCLSEGLGGGGSSLSEDGLMSSSIEAHFSPSSATALDRYGRFKRAMDLDFDLSGESECAIMEEDEDEEDDDEDMGGDDGELGLMQV